MRVLPYSAAVLLCASACVFAADGNSSNLRQSGSALNLSGTESTATGRDTGDSTSFLLEALGHFSSPSEITARVARDNDLVNLARKREWVNVWKTLAKRSISQFTSIPVAKYSIVIDMLERVPSLFVGGTVTVVTMALYWGDEAALSRLFPHISVAAGTGIEPSLLARPPHVTCVKCRSALQLALVDHSQLRHDEFELLSDYQVNILRCAFPSPNPVVSTAPRDFGVESLRRVDDYSSLRLAVRQNRMQVVGELLDGMIGLMNSPHLIHALRAAAVEAAVASHFCMMDLLLSVVRAWAHPIFGADNGSFVDDFMDNVVQQFVSRKLYRAALRVSAMYFSPEVSADRVFKALRDLPDTAISSFGKDIVKEAIKNRSFEETLVSLLEDHVMNCRFQAMIEWRQCGVTGKRMDELFDVMLANAQLGLSSKMKRPVVSAVNDMRTFLKTSKVASKYDKRSNYNWDARRDYYDGKAQEMLVTVETALRERDAPLRYNYSRLERRTVARDNLLRKVGAQPYVQPENLKSALRNPSAKYNVGSIPIRPGNPHGVSAEDAVKHLCNSPQRKSHFVAPETGYIVRLNDTPADNLASCQNDADVVGSATAYGLQPRLTPPRLFSSKPMALSEQRDTGSQSVLMSKRIDRQLSYSAPAFGQGLSQKLRDNEHMFEFDELSNLEPFDDSMMMGDEEFFSRMDISPVPGQRKIRVVSGDFREQKRDSTLLSSAPPASMLRQSSAPMTAGVSSLNVCEPGVQGMDPHSSGTESFGAVAFRSKSVVSTPKHDTMHSMSGRFDRDLDDHH